MAELRCRSCGDALRTTVVDLGRTPLANSYVSDSELGVPDRSYPLHARVCETCFLVQVEDVVPPEEIFGDYAYFSSYSSSWIEHARRFCEWAEREYELDGNSLVVEVASNDGYLLKNFVASGVPVLGVEPALNVADAAIAAGVPTRKEFFNSETAKEMSKEGVFADLVVANNVLAHVPNLNDFVAGFPRILAPGGVLVLEFPHLLELLQHVEFDTIYHEHFSYFSLLAVESLFARHGLRVFRVDRIPTHGGSLRLHVCRSDAEGFSEHPSVEALRKVEEEFGINSIGTYIRFARATANCQQELLGFLQRCRDTGVIVAAYGAAAKGNTLLNSTGVTKDLIGMVADLSPHKQGKYLPGSRIPVVAPEALLEGRPDVVLILAWNLRTEIEQQLQLIRTWGGKFAVPIPNLEIW